MKLIDKDKFWNKYKRLFPPEIIVATWFIFFITTLVLTSNGALSLFVFAIVVAVTSWLEIEYSEYLRN